MAGPTPRWRKSSHSVDNGNANCVEAGTVVGTVLVRDTTDRDGTTLALSARAWRRFTTQIRETAKP
jgi:hypothetical protein